MYNILLIVQILVALGIIGLVLVQHGKGADAGAAFSGGGGGASGSVFGSRGASNFLSRTTAILALVFFLNSMGLAWLVSHRSDGSPTRSLVDSVVPAVEETVPAAANDVPDVPDGTTPETKANEGAVPDAPAPAASIEKSPVADLVPEKVPASPMVTKTPAVTNVTPPAEVSAPPAATTAGVPEAK